MPSVKASWTAVLRSATSETRLTESTSDARSTRATVRCSEGKSDLTLGNSPSSRRVVVRRTPPPAEPSKPMMPSPAPPAPPEDSAIEMSLPPVSALAVSASTLAGTRAAASMSGAEGDQPSSRWESRKRSVASMAIASPSSSMRTPVSTGSMSSRPAAVTACETAAAKTPLGTVPRASGMVGSVG